MGDGEIRCIVETECRHAQPAVRRNWHVEPLCFFPQRIEFWCAIKPPTRCHRGQNGADHAQVVHGAPQFFYGFRDILNRQQCDADETGAHLHELVVEPIVVRTRHADSPVFILNGSVSQSLSGIKNRQLDLVLVEKIEPVIGLWPVAAAGPAAFLS